MDYVKRIRLGFRWMAPIYDCFDLFFVLDRRRNPREALASRIPDQPLRILDACTGTASLAALIAGHCPRSAVVGVDLSPEMLARGRAKIAGRKLRNVELREMDAAKLEFGDADFDVATISFGLHEMPRELMLCVLAEMARVVKPGGKLYIIDYEREGGPLRRMAFAAFLRVLEPSHMPEFLEHDWGSLLSGAGWRLDSTEVYFCSKLMTSTRSGAAARPPGKGEA